MSESKYDFWLRQTFREKPSQMLGDWGDERFKLQMQLKFEKEKVEKLLSIISRCQNEAINYQEDLEGYQIENIINDLEIKDMK